MKSAINRRDAHIGSGLLTCTRLRVMGEASVCVSVRREQPEGQRLLGQPANIALSCRQELCPYFRLSSPVLGQPPQLFSRVHFTARDMTRGTLSNPEEFKREDEIFSIHPGEAALARLYGASLSLVSPPSFDLPASLSLGPIDSLLPRRLLARLDIRILARLRAHCSVRLRRSRVTAPSSRSRREGAMVVHNSQKFSQVLTSCEEA